MIRARVINKKGFIHVSFRDDDDDHITIVDLMRIHEAEGGITIELESIALSKNYQAGITEEMVLNAIRKNIHNANICFKASGRNVHGKKI